MTITPQGSNFLKLATDAQQDAKRRRFIKEDRKSSAAIANVEAAS